MMEIKEAIKKVESGEIAPVYLLTGAEFFFHDQIIHALEEKIFTDPASKNLNTIRLFGTENSLGDVLSAAMGFPMLVQMKLVVVKDFEKLKLTDADTFLSYLKKPQNTTCLVLSCQEQPRNKTFKMIKELSIEIDCKPIKEYRIMDWLMELARSKDMDFEEQAANLLIDHTGTDLLSLSLELDKIQDYKNDNSLITMEHIRNITGLTKDFSVFGLQDALAQKDLKLSLKIARRLLESGDNINLILGVLFSFFKRLIQAKELSQQGQNRQQIASSLKLRDFQVRDLLQAARNYEIQQLEKIVLLLAGVDNDIKTSRTDDKSALLMLCYNICRI